MRPEWRPFAMRRGKAPNLHRAGDGHGEPTYVPVRRTNWLASEDGREHRREQLRGRDERTAAYVASLRKRLAEGRPPWAGRA